MLSFILLKNQILEVSLDSSQNEACVGSLGNIVAMSEGEELLPPYLLKPSEDDAEFRAHANSFFKIEVHEELSNSFELDVGGYPELEGI